MLSKTSKCKDNEMKLLSLAKIAKKQLGKFYLHQIIVSKSKYKLVSVNRCIAYYTYLVKKPLGYDAGRQLPKKLKEVKIQLKLTEF